MSLVTSFARLLSEPVPVSSTDGRIIVIVAVLGALATVGAAWAQGTATRRQATAANVKAEQARTLAATVADSVGPQNGHGTVQDATGVLIEEFREWREEVRSELQATRSTVESLVTSASTINDRLKDHDREHADHRRQDRAHAEKILELDARLQDRSTS